MDLARVYIVLTLLLSLCGGTVSACTWETLASSFLVRPSVVSVEARQPVGAGGEVETVVFVRPVYALQSEVATLADISGPVVLEAKVAPTGEVLKVDLLEGLIPEVDNAAIKACLASRFSSVPSPSEPVLRRVRLEYVFTGSKAGSVDVSDLGDDNLAQLAGREVPSRLADMGVDVDSVELFEVVLPSVAHRERRGFAEVASVSLQTYEHGVVETIEYFPPVALGEVDCQRFLKIVTTNSPWWGSRDHRYSVPGYCDYRLGARITRSDETIYVLFGVGRNSDVVVASETAFLGGGRPYRWQVEMLKALAERVMFSSYNELVW